MTVGPEREVNIRVFYTRVEKIFSKVRANWGSSFLVFWKRYKTGGFFYTLAPQNMMIFFHKVIKETQFN